MSAELEELAGIRKALESIALALGTLVAFAMPTLESIDAKLPKPRKAPRKRRRKRKPLGVAASLVSLVLLTGCGGVVDGGGETNRVEQGPVLDAEGGAVRVEQRDSGVDGQAVECTPDAERTTGVLCEHPKRRGDAG